MDQSYATQIAVRPLSAEDSRSVVASALVAGSIVDDLAQSIVRKGEGNPFFLEELARSVAERGAQRVRRNSQTRFRACFWLGSIGSRSPRSGCCGVSGKWPMPATTSEKRARSSSAWGPSGSLSG
jgi:hypothetical protein